MPDFLDDATKPSTCSNARLAHRGGPDPARDLLDERVAGRFHRGTDWRHRLERA